MADVSNTNALILEAAMDANVEAVQSILQTGEAGLHCIMLLMLAVWRL